MILLGLGANLPSAAGSPEKTLQAALQELQTHTVKIISVSPFYRTAPVPVSDQPWFVNAVASATSSYSPHQLLELLKKIERGFGRVRGSGDVKNAARTLDLDILDYENRIISDDELTLPHPQLHTRAFVLHPLRDIAPEWRHPSSGTTVSELVKALNAEQKIERA